MMRVNLQPILKYGIEIVSNTIMQGYPFDSHMDRWVPFASYTDGWGTHAFSDGNPTHYDAQ